MAARRKYKGRAPVEADVAVAAAPPAAAPAAAASPATPPASSLQQQIEAQRHAEDLQRQHAHRQQIGLPEAQLTPEQRQAVDQLVDNIPNLTDHQKRFLKSHPTLLQEPYVDLMRHAILVARHAGIPDDTPAMDDAILLGVARDLEHHRALKALTSPQALPTEENRVKHDARINDAMLQEMAQEHSAAQEPKPPAPAAPPIRRSIPVSAPVSRNVPMASGGRTSTRVTLSPEEREIANISFKHLPAHQREIEYAKNKRRLAQMRADGRYPMPETN